MWADAALWAVVFLFVGLSEELIARGYLSVRLDAGNQLLAGRKPALAYFCRRAHSQPRRGCDRDCCRWSHWARAGMDRQMERISYGGLLDSMRHGIGPKASSMERLTAEAFTHAPAQHIAPWRAMVVRRICGAGGKCSGSAADPSRGACRPVFPPDARPGVEAPDLNDSLFVSCDCACRAAHHAQIVVRVQQNLRAAHAG